MRVRVAVGGGEIVTEVVRLRLTVSVCIVNSVIHAEKRLNEPAPGIVHREVWLPLTPPWKSTYAVDTSNQTYTYEQFRSEL